MKTVVLHQPSNEWPGDMAGPEEFDEEDDTQDELLPDDDGDTDKGDLLLDDDEDYLDEEE